MSGLAVAARLALAITGAVSSVGCVGGALDRAEPDPAGLERPLPGGPGPVTTPEPPAGSAPRDDARLFPRALDPIPPLYVPPRRNLPLQPVLERSLLDSAARPTRRTAAPAPLEIVDPLGRIDPVTGRDPLGRVDPSGGVDLGGTGRR